ncbi:HNH endonuclease signature motif containing protein [Vibrio proteolyticus]
MTKKYDSNRPVIRADLRREIEVEAGHQCSVTGCFEHTYMEIHHIDFNRENNSPENLIYLCDKHHKMAHSKVIDRKALRKYKESLKQLNNQAVQTPHVESNFRSSLQVVDIFEVFDENSEEFYPTTMEIKLRNIGEDVAFLKEIVFETIGYWEIHTDLHHSMVEVSATYDVQVSNQINSVKTIKVHNEVKPQETDRIQFRLRGNDGADPEGLSLYLLKIKVVYNEDSSESGSPIVILNIRPHTESHGYYFHRYSKGTITRNKHVANELLRLTNEGAVCSDYILNAAESWLGAPDEEEYFSQFDD